MSPLSPLIHALNDSAVRFETVWRERREFRIDGEPIQVARLMHIVTSKALAGRPKDHLFLATHAEALRELLPKDERPGDAG